MRGMIMTKPALDKAMMFVALFQLALRSGTALCADAGSLTHNRTARATTWRRIEIGRRAEIRFTDNDHTSRVTLSAARPPSQPLRHLCRRNRRKPGPRASYPKPLARG